jgi:hydroxypyruvate isomerase
MTIPAASAQARCASRDVLKETGPQDVNAQFSQDVASGALKGSYGRMNGLGAVRRRKRFRTRHEPAPCRLAYPVFRMPNLAANLSLLFPQLEFRQRFAAAAKAGFRAVEYQFPYAWPAQEIAECARAANLEVVLHNLPAGDSARGERGIACLPRRRDEFRAGVARAIEYARTVRCPRLNCLAGVIPDGAPRTPHFDTLVDNVRYAAGALREAGLQLMLEACNRRTVPGFFIATTDEALEVLDAAGADNAFLQYDIFHMQIMEGDLAATTERLLSRIGHMQLADVPERHEPGTGEINFPFLLAHLDRIGYRGWIGCEYNPVSDTLEGLKWAKPYL